MASQYGNAAANLAGARLVARLVARDGTIDWREIEFLDASGAFDMLGIARGRFMHMVGECLGAQLGARAGGARAPGLEADILAVRDRLLQLVVAALLVYVAEIDRNVGREESVLVRKVLEQWSIDAGVLREQLGVPLARSRAALGPASPGRATSPA